MQRLFLLACLLLSVLTAAAAAETAEAKGRAAGIEAAQGAAKPLMDAGNYEAALRHYTAALEKTPRNALLLRERARAHIRLGNHKAAINDLTSSLALDPKDPISLNLRGSCLNLTGALKDARADFDRSIELDPTYPSPYTNRAWNRRQQGDLKGALADYDSALRILPDDEVSLRSRAAVHAQLGNHLAAVEDYKKACSANPNNKDNFNNQGNALLKLGRTREALACYDKALALDPKFTLAHVNRGLAREKAGDKAGAHADFKQALQLDPANKVAQQHLSALSGPNLPPKAPTAAESTAVSSAPTQPPAAATPQGSTPAAKPLAKASGPKAGSTGIPSKEQTPAAPKATAEKTPPKAEKPVPSAKPPRIANTPPPPTPPAPSATPASPRRMSGFKLVSIDNPYTYDYGSYTGKGINGGYSIKVSGDYAFSASLSWSVPELIIPTRPALLRLNCSSSSVYDASIRFSTAGWGGASLSRTLVAVRLHPDYPAVASNSYELVLPDLAGIPALVEAGKADTKLCIRYPSKELEDVIGGGGDGAIATTKTPSQLAPELLEHPARSWMTPESGYREYGDLTLTVAAHRSIGYAVFTYRWTPDCGPLLDDDPADADRIEFVATPASRTELRADGRDGLWLMARLMPKSGQPGPELQAASASLGFMGVGEGAAWLDFSEPVLRNGWQLVYVQASNPDVVRGPSKPPATLTVQASAGGTLTRQLTLTIPPEAEIDAKPDSVEFAAKSGLSTPVKLWIDNPGKDPWKFRHEYAPRARPLAKVRLVPTGDNAAVVRLDEAGLEPLPDGSHTEVAVLNLIAEQKDRAPLVRELKVIVGQEGLFVLGTGRDPEEGHFRLEADGSGKPRDVDFRVFEFNPGTRKLVNSKDTVGRLLIECLEPEGSLAAQALKVADLKVEFAGMRAGNEPSGIYRFSCAKEIPGDGRVIKADYRVSIPGRDTPASSAIITLGLATTANGPGGKNWQHELDECQEVINRFVPVNYRAKLQATLDRHKRTLGAEGLHQLRNHIWRIAVELTLGEGGQGYANEAAWADNITYVLEWSQWAGDMAFTAAIGTVTGPYGAVGAGMLKTSVISAINAYQEGRSAEDWLWENLATIPAMIEGKVIDPDTFQQWGMESKAKAWALYISYQFIKNLYSGATVIEALKNTAKEVSGNLLGSWLGEQAKKSAAKSAATAANQKQSPGKQGSADEGTTVRTSPLPSSNEALAAQRVRSRMSIQGGRPYANADDVLTIMRDPSMVRALKNSAPEVQAAFSNTREAIYRQHDAAVVQHLKDTNPDLKYRMVKVMEFRTPGQTGASLNTDRDYRVCYYAGRNPHTGKEQWIEVDRRQWENHSYETFARLTGGPADTPQNARHWAEQHQQLATDKSHMEASPDFADQAKVWNPDKRQFENAQIVSNITRVKAGQPGVSLKDPAALGQMYQVKVADARFKHEAFVQAQKAVKDLDAVREGYNLQKRKVGELPPSMREGMNAVIKVNEQLARDPNRRDPAAIAEAERVLRENGFSSLNDFMNKLSSQFESLKTMR